MENNSLYNKKSYTGRTLFSIVIIVLLATLPFHYVLKDTIMNSGTDPLGNSMKTVDKYADFREFPNGNAICSMSSPTGTTFLLKKN